MLEEAEDDWDIKAERCYLLDLNFTRAENHVAFCYYIVQGKYSKTKVLK